MPRHYRRKRKRGNFLKKKVYKNARVIKQLSRAIEYKFFDSAQTADGMDTTGATVVLNAMLQGTTANTVSVRDGNKVQARRLTIRGLMRNINGTPTDTVVRIIIFRAKNQNNANQTIALLTEDGATNVNTMLRDVHKKRYQILADKTFSMDTAAHSIIPFYFTHKCNTVVTYNGNAGTFADIEDGAYYIGYFGISAAGANAPTIDFSARFYFLDA